MVTVGLFVTVVLPGCVTEGGMEWVRSAERV
jgi:hypothetical protein